MMMQAIASEGIGRHGLSALSDEEIAAVAGGAGAADGGTSDGGTHGGGTSLPTNDLPIPYNCGGGQICYIWPLVYRAN